jgi:hypothetical protein
MMITFEDAHPPPKMIIVLSKMLILTALSTFVSTFGGAAAAGPGARQRPHDDTAEVEEKFLRVRPRSG